MLAIFVATLVASSRLLRLVFDDLDVVAYLGLFVACWIGAGGALVPVPGVRPISWLMIIQQGAALDPVIVTLVAAGAMALGQTSYFLVTRRAVRSLGSTPGEPGDGVAEPGPADADAGVDAALEKEPGGDPGADGEAGGEAPGRVARARRRVVVGVRRHTFPTVFLVSLVPSPATTVATSAAASVGVSYGRWLVPALSGYLVFAGILSLVGQGLLAGLGSLLP